MEPFSLFLNWLFYTGNKVSGTNFSLLIVTGNWLLAMVVIIYAYTGVLTALLSIPKLEKTIETLEELASSSRFKLTIESHSFMTSQLLVHKSYVRFLNFHLYEEFLNEIEWNRKLHRGLTKCLGINYESIRKGVLMIFFKWLTR